MVIGGGKLTMPHVSRLLTLVFLVTAILNACAAPVASPPTTAPAPVAVSYTHLTLPTILLV